MKVPVVFTHRARFYGCPVYVSFARDGGFLSKPVYSGTGWWCDHVAPGIQAVRAWLCDVLAIDSPESGGFRLDDVRPLANPIHETLTWPDDAEPWDQAAGPFDSRRPA